MIDWQRQLKVNPIPALLSSGDSALCYFTRRDLVEEPTGPVEALWETPDALKIVKKQQGNGSRCYPGKSDVLQSASELVAKIADLEELGFRAIRDLSGQNREIW
ncbi:MAG: hypothetical protein JXA14_12760 [Anaerolineae bacterium]|jgi:hypothetical protein|nr:hypothetical protein [Anaerolineae bacterium]